MIRLVIRLRHWLYDKKVLPTLQSPIPVVSVGNIVLGGSGKTPFVALLAQELVKRGVKVAVVSRGYRSFAEKRARPLLLSRGQGALFSSEVGGDEPVLLAERVKGAQVIVGRDRWQGALLAQKEGAELVLLDDGMQHRRLARALEIVSVDGSDPLAGKRFLPFGRLRDDPRRLQCADLLVTTGSCHKVQTRVARYTSAPILGLKTKVLGIFDEKEELKALPQGERVALFCGIANPKRFEKTVEGLGLECVSIKTLRDHSSIGTRGLVRFAKKACKKGAKWLICTEKDWVKLDRQALRCQLPVVHVKIELEIIENSERWDKILSRIVGLIK